MSLALLCPGQGGQHPAMLDAVAGDARAEAVLARLPDGLRARLAAGEALYDNASAQPLICAAILARWAVLEPLLPPPALILGYSVGELAAHAIAGTFDAPTCLHLANRRAALMDAASPPGAGLLAVLGLSRARIDALCTAHDTAVAIVNGPQHYVLGGTAAGLAALEPAALAQGARVVRIKVCAPAHTHWLAEAASGFAAELAQVPLRAPALPVLAGIDGQAVRSAAEAAATLAAQIARPVAWQSCLTEARERGVTVLLELGPGSALTRIARELYPDCAARSLDEFGTLPGAVAWVERALVQAGR